MLCRHAGVGTESQHKPNNSVPKSRKKSGPDGAHQDRTCGPRRLLARDIEPTGRSLFGLIKNVPIAIARCILSQPRSIASLIPAPYSAGPESTAHLNWNPSYDDALPLATGGLQDGSCKEAIKPRA
jgi:hypothetical protein